jgi:hypothetical protein
MKVTDTKNYLAYYVAELASIVKELAKAPGAESINF